MKLLTLSPRESFRIDSGVVTTSGETGIILERYECRLFLADLPNTQIVKGKLSPLPIPR